MRKLILAISMLALAGSAAFADPVLDRQALMKERGKIVGGLNKVVKGEEPYDAAAVLSALQALQANAEKFDVATLFPAGSDDGDTTAAPKIWPSVSPVSAMSRTTCGSNPHPSRRRHRRRPPRPTPPPAAA